MLLAFRHFYYIMEIIFLLFAFYFSLSFHEAAHAYIAYLCGDRTLEVKERISLNPLVHIDLIGTVLLPLIGIFFSPGIAIFGWGRPVVINPYYFKNRKLGELFTSISGPLSNLLLIVISIFLSRFILKNYGHEFQPALMLIAEFIKINVVLGIFNLLPIPPLDGSGILKFFLSEKLEYFFQKFYTWGIIILLIIINTRYFNYLLIIPMNIAFSYAGLYAGL